MYNIGCTIYITRDVYACVAKCSGVAFDTIITSVFFPLKRKDSTKKTTQDNVFICIDKILRT